MPSSATSMQREPFVARRPDPDLGGVRVLGRVGQRLGDDVVRRGLDRLGQPVARARRRSHRQRRASGQRLDRRLETAIAEHRRMDAAGELAQLLERLGELLAGALERLARARVVGLAGAGREPQVERRARRAAAARRRAGCARAGGARRRRPRRSGRARRRAPSRACAFASAWAASSAKSAIRCSAPSGTARDARWRRSPRPTAGRRASPARRRRSGSRARAASRRASPAMSS